MSKYNFTTRAVFSCFDPSSNKEMQAYENMFAFVYNKINTKNVLLVSHLWNQQKPRSFGIYFVDESMQKLVNNILINDRKDYRMAHPLKESLIIFNKIKY